MTSARMLPNRVFRVKPRSLAPILAAALLSSVLLAHAAGAGNDETVHTLGNVSYVSGGVGTESLDRLGSLTKDFNLKLVFALKSGEYVSSVKVTIADPAGKSLLDATSEGPWFLAKLPAGSYQISATFAGKAEMRKIAVDAKKLKVLDFRWASE